MAIFGVDFVLLVLLLWFQIEKFFDDFDFELFANHGLHRSSVKLFCLSFINQISFSNFSRTLVKLLF